MARDSRADIRIRIHKRIRRRVAGTEERPRLAVFRSVNHIYAQVIDDAQGHTLGLLRRPPKKRCGVRAATWKAQS